ncbi:UNVERIFIED_CONTAM: Ferruginol synthase [Sesamum radiatum]|uniref:Ferruginol synthase n=1 Tax=Sesamum radiatum TaxID=300843 RepID=A0AAW2QEY0_SESRA
MAIARNQLQTITGQRGIGRRIRDCQAAVVKETFRLHLTGLLLLPHNADSDTEINDLRGQNFELIPFGSGRRMCPGLPSGCRILHVVVATLIHSFA